jgi:hypothetical protein
MGFFNIGCFDDFNSGMDDVLFQKEKMVLKTTDVD